MKHYSDLKKIDLPEVHHLNTGDANKCPDCSKEIQASPKTPGRQKLRNWLNKNMKIEMTDGRTLIGIFLCTDSDRNIILGSCSEYLKPDDDDGAEDEPRVLGLAMVPGHHIVSIHIDSIKPMLNVPIVDKFLID